MKKIAVIGLVVLFPLLLFSSCVHLKTGDAVKAGYNIDSEPSRAAFNPRETKDGWASRYIPGWKAINRLIPPPNEARRKWDDRYRSHNGQSENSDSL